VPSQSIIDGAPTRTALLGIATPVSDIKIPDFGIQVVTVVVTTQFGTVFADTAPDATVRGSGSLFLSISSTTTQVATKLATLTYSSSTTGIDQLSIRLVVASGTVVPIIQTPLTVLPLISTPTNASKLVYFDHGTLTLESRKCDGADLALRELAGSQNATTLVLSNTTIGATSNITIRNDNDGGALMPRLAVAGRVELDGTTNLAGNGTAVSLALGAALVNEGSMAFDAHATRFTGGGTLVNEGLIRITGDGVAGTPVQIDTALAGSGTITLISGASLELGASVAAGETIRLDIGANTLHLAHAGAFAGTIAGFSRGDALVLDGTSVSNAIYTRSGETGDGVITLLQDDLTIAKIRFTAPETGTVFHLGIDAVGNATLSLAAVNPGTVDVFRFFDAAHGTQLLTQDATERDTILSTRSDLHYEGVGLRAIDPAHTTPNTVDVYRFFDTINGTHFMTSSLSERDIVLASRSDLIFEKSSTMVEHATAQTGDSAVYRFFDSTNGAHFYTANADERAAILSTRPDMTLEGIAFYAPTA
jgi:hypothetical protein